MGSVNLYSFVLRIQFKFPEISQLCLRTTCFPFPSLQMLTIESHSSILSLISNVNHIFKKILILNLLWSFIYFIGHSTPLSQLKVSHLTIGAVRGRIGEITNAIVIIIDNDTGHVFIDFIEIDHWPRVHQSSSTTLSICNCSTSEESSKACQITGGPEACPVPH